MEGLRIAGVPLDGETGRKGGRENMKGQGC